MRAAAELKSASDSVAAGPDRGRRLARALANIEELLQQRCAAPVTDEEPPEAEDRALVPSPGVERKARELHDELCVLLENVRSMRAEIRGAPGDQSASAIDTRLRELAHTLERHEHGEIDLVQQAITPDIGAGD
jgi:hypothetical protein